MRISARRWGVGSAILAGLVLTVFVPVGASALAEPGASPATASPTHQWAYGAEKWVNVSVTVPNATYSAQAFFGWHVVFTATNTSLTTVELEAQRTMVASFSATMCSPNCTHPSFHGSMNVRGAEQDAGFTNLTALASVYENHTAVPALGVENASARSHATLTESYSATITLGGASHTASGNFDAVANSSAAIEFSPALGLVPWNVAPGQSWSSTSAFTAHGVWSVVYNWSRSAFAGGTVSGSGNPQASVNASGNVTVIGRDVGNITLTNGQKVPVIELAFLGPFDDLDGVIFVPHAGGMFSVGANPVGHTAFGLESVTTAQLDISVDALHHQAVFAAAATANAPVDTTLGAMAVPLAGGVVQLAPAVGPPPPPPPYDPSAVAVAGNTYQAQPESVPAAQHASSCMLGACGPIASVASTALGYVLVIGLVVAAVVGTVAVVEYKRWRLRTGPLTEMPGRSAAIREESAIPLGAYGPAPGSAPAPPPSAPFAPPRPPMGR
ncbi:MAG TPA: hypothetical protein VFF67_09820 [Thermoplasmata archaeon]|nr:hypothetical protein [Thermoplasmata archaeon]